MYWLYRSFCSPSVRFNNVGPPMLAISSINELVAPLLDILSVGRRRLSFSRSGDLRIETISQCHRNKISSNGVSMHPDRKSIYLLLGADESSFSSTFNFLFLGCGLCTNVQSWLWNRHNTQLACPSFIWHRLFLLLHASHGLSFFDLAFVVDSAEVVLLMLADSRPLLLFLPMLGLSID